MSTIRVLAILVIAAIPLSANAQTISFNFREEWNWLDEHYKHVVITVNGQLKAPLNVDYSYSFPSIGLSSGGTETFEPSTYRDDFGFLGIEFPIDGMYHPPLEGTISMTYTPPGGSPITRTSNLYVEYWEPNLRVEESRAVEGADVHTATLTLTRPSAVPVTVSVSAISGSAHDGVDFILLDHTATFISGSTEAQVRFQALQDGTAEGEESFQIKAGTSPSDKPALWPETGTITIDDAEIAATIDPSSSDIYSGDWFSLTLTLGRPVSLIKKFTALVTTSDPAVANPQIDSIEIPPGVTSFVIPVESSTPGAATITVTFPDELAMGPATASVNVFGGEFSFDRATALVRKKEQFTVGINMSPAPPVPMEIGAELSRGGVILLGAPAYIGTDGGGSFTFTGIGTGTVDVMIVNRGRGNPLATLQVRVIESFSAKSIAPKEGSAGGGTAVTITGTGFGGQCTVLFDRIAATNVTVVNETTLRAIAPAHANGIADVTVGCDAHVETLPRAFTFRQVKGRAVRH